ncbi:MAG: hypothetical protein ACFFDP_07910 [Promethearchaeota archaeon]
MTSEKKETKSKQKVKKPRPTWEEVTEHVYERILWYSTRFILTSIVGVVVGVIGLVYAGLMIIALGVPLGNISVFLGVFIGVGALVVSLILLAWGGFWRKKVENRSIF